MKRPKMRVTKLFTDPDDAKRSAAASDDVWTDKVCPFALGAGRVMCGSWCALFAIETVKVEKKKELIIVLQCGGKDIWRNIDLEGSNLRKIKKLI